MTDIPSERAARIGEALDSTDAADSAALVAAHPSLAPELGLALRARRALRESALPPPGARLGDFEVVRELGRGGMGVVYEGIQHPLGRRVALKVVERPADWDEARRREFDWEARTLARLGHPHVVPVLAAGEWGGLLYHAMPLVEGRPPTRESLGGHRAAAALAARVARALAHAHALGIVHRDVKPANVLVDAGGHVWLTDFGLAAASGAGRAGSAGTPGYISPEQLGVVPGQVDHRGDVFALGVTLYELLTGQPPFARADLAEYRASLAAGDAPPPRRVCRTVPADLNRVVRRALARDPADRYPDAAALADDLERFLSRDPGRWAWRNRWRVAAALAVAGLALATALRVRSERRAEASRAAARELARDVMAVCERVLSVTPRQTELRLRLLTQVADQTARLAEAPGATPEDRHAAAVAAFLAGDREHHRGAYAEAEARNAAAVAGFERLAAEFPERHEYAFDVFHALTGWGRALEGLRRMDDHRAACDRSLVVIRDLATAHPEVAHYQDALANALVESGRRLEDDPAAAEAFAAAAALAEDTARRHPERAAFFRRNVARAWSLHGRWLARTGRPGALELYRRSLDLFAELIRLEPPGSRDSVTMIPEWWNEQLNLARLLSDAGRRAEAAAACAAAKAGAEAFLRDYPGYRSAENIAAAAADLARQIEAAPR